MTYTHTPKLRIFLSNSLRVNFHRKWPNSAHKKDLDKLNIPENVVVKGSNSGWWNASLDKELLESLFQYQDETPTIFIRDQFAVHKMRWAAEFLEDKNVKQLFVSAVRTDQFQPLLINYLLHPVYFRWTVYSHGRVLYF